MHLDDRVVSATLREESEHSARIEFGDRVLRVLHDVSDAGLRVEVEGRAYAFSSDTAGQVRAGAPAMVVALHVEPGDTVAAGQLIGVLEAMKMEVGIDAPVAGVVSEVRARKGEQVAAGDVILVIDPSSEEHAEPAARRIELEEHADPLQPLFAPMAGELLGVPDIAAAERAPLPVRRAAIAAAREETRRVLLGYDANPERADRLAEFLEAPLPDELGDSFRRELAELRSELQLLADVACLFVRAPAASVSGEHGPSNEARLRMYVRRVRAEGAGVDEAFLERVRAALVHYGIHSLAPSDALERALLRLLASQRQPDTRDRFALAILRRLTALARQGGHLASDAALASALAQLSSMRGLVSNAVADAAIEARYEIFERPQIEGEAERTSKEVEGWLEAAASEPTAPPEPVLRDLADASRSVFDRLGGWIGEADPRRRAIALAAHLRRAYSPSVPVAQATVRDGEVWLERIELPGGRIVLGAAASAETLGDAVDRLVQEAERGRDAHEWPAVHALEVFAPHPERDATAELAAVAARLRGGLPAARVTLSLVRPLGARRASHPGPRPRRLPRRREPARPAPRGRGAGRPGAPRELRPGAAPRARGPLLLPRPGAGRGGGRARLRARRPPHPLAGGRPRGRPPHPRLRARLLRGHARAAAGCSPCATRSAGSSGTASPST